MHAWYAHEHAHINCVKGSLNVKEHLEHTTGAKQAVRMALSLLQILGGTVVWQPELAGSVCQTPKKVAAHQSILVQAVSLCC